MVLFQVLILFEVLRVPKLSNNDEMSATLTASLRTTIVSLVSTALILGVESKGLNESYTEYVMFSLNAKQDWVAFG
jgi:hypothetical protein